MNTVLLFLDNMDQQQILEEMLSEQYLVIDSLDITASHQFDICIADRSVLDRQAEQFREFKKIKPNLFLPILLLTPYPDPELFSRSWWEIIDDILETPVQKQILILRIKALLRSRNQKIEEKSVFDTILEHKQLQDELTETKERYRSLFNSIDEGFCIVQMVFDDMGKPVDYIFLELNLAFAKQTGIENAVGKNIRSIAPYIEEYWIEIIGTVALTGKSIRFTNESKQLHRWFNVYESRFGKPEDHQVAILFQDVTDQTISEMKLRDSEDRFHTLADNIPQLAWMADPQGEIFWYNKRWYDFTGTSWEIMKSEGIQKVIHKEHLHDVMSSFNIALSTGISWEYTFKMMKADGSYCWFLTRAMPIHDANGKIFDMHFARNLFEPFKRLHAEKEYSGTGIGLSIVMRVITRHGGKIWAEGEINNGATFYFTLGI